MDWVIPCQVIKKKKFFNPVSPNWPNFGTSVALHVSMKLAKLFQLIQNGFRDMPY